MIKSIYFKLQGYDNKYVNINLDGKNLIITGQNGCGKTRFLNQMFSFLSSIVNRNLQPKEEIERQLQQAEGFLATNEPSHPNYQHYLNAVKQYKQQLERCKNEQINFIDNETPYTLHNQKLLVLHNFPANRLENKLAGKGSIESLKTLINQGKTREMQQTFNQDFEKYMVSYYNYQSHVIARENDEDKSQKIEQWFLSVEKDIQTLFEDSELKLKYNAEENAFYIHQVGKVPFRFNQLSSGYTAILNIYAELLMKVELKGIPAKELQGFVFIDEIDVHLHVSIQKKIFSFFNQTFPNIQFFITTHSPFVIQSVDDAIIYDLSKDECLEDLSMYSYQAILKGLLGVDTISNSLNEKINELATLIQKDIDDIHKLEKLIESIEPHEQHLDVQSRAFVALAKNKLLDLSAGA